MTKEDKAAWISGSCAIIAAIIGIFSININIENNKLDKDIEMLKSENDSLKTKIADLEVLLSQYDSLKEENDSLKMQMEILQNEIPLLIEDNPNWGIQDEISYQSSDVKTGNKVSIFDLDTFQGYANWHDHSYTVGDSNLTFIDTYGNEYLTGWFGQTVPSIKDKSCPTYFLDKKYSTFEGQFVWSKVSKNIEGSVWLEFYSENNLIYITDAISATDKITSFEFDVKDIDTLTIVENGSNSSYEAVTVIYPFLNLVE